MIRFIIKSNFHDPNSEAKYSRLTTMDLEVPILERKITSGGYGNQGYEIHELYGIEILE